MFGLGILVFGGLYLAVCIWLSRKITSKIANRAGRVASLVAVLIALVLLPAADGIWGNISLKQLCAEQSKTEVFQKIVFPASQLDANMKPRQTDEYGAINWKAIRQYVELRSRAEILHRGTAEIERATWSLIRPSDGAEVARATAFYYRGGWFRTNGNGLGADRCIPQPSLDAVLPTILIPQT
jgi:hypothetical protein